MSSCSIASYLSDPGSIFFGQSALVMQMSNAALLGHKYWTKIVQVARDWTTGPK